MRFSYRVPADQDILRRLLEAEEKKLTETKTL